MKVYTEIPTNPEAYLEQSRISLMEIFEKIFRGFQQLNTFAKSSAIDVRRSSKYTSEICRKLISISLRNIVQQQLFGAFVVKSSALPKAAAPRFFVKKLQRLYRSLFLIKFQAEGLQLYERSLRRRTFPVLFSQNTLGRLLLAFTESLS